MNPLRPIQVLIVDDHLIIREGLAAILNQQSDMEIVAEAASGQEAVEAFRRHRPDVTLMDLQMPNGDGLFAIKAIRKEAPYAAIIVLTSHECDEFIHQTIKEGVRAYLLKTDPREEILRTIRGVSSGQRCITPQIAARLAERMSRPELTAREGEVLTLITKGQSNQEIGNALFITEGTVKAHVNSILSKLSVSDRTQATLIAIKHGLVPWP